MSKVMNNKFLLAAIGLVSLALIVFLGAETRNAWQNYYYIGKSGRDTISIDGEGKVTAKPDVALVELGVITDAATVNLAQTQNTSKMNAVIDAVKVLGVEAKDIQTENYNIQPRYDYSTSKQTLIGYEVSQNVAVKVRNLDKVGDIIAKAGDLGANQVGGMSFTIDDPKALQEQAREKAIDDAKSKADLLAKKLGLQVVRVVSFTESSGNVTPPMPYYAMDKAMAGAAPSVAPTVEAGSQDVISDVSVTFEIR